MKRFRQKRLWPGEPLTTRTGKADYIRIGAVKTVEHEPVRWPGHASQACPCASLELRLAHRPVDLPQASSCSLDEFAHDEFIVRDLPGVLAVLQPADHRSGDPPPTADGMARRAPGDKLQATRSSGCLRRSRPRAHQPRCAQTRPQTKRQ